MLDINKTYSLITKYPVTLGSKVKNIRLVGILTFTQATLIEDVITLHQNVLKEADYTDVINNVSNEDMLYYHFKDDSNNSRIIAASYINTFEVSGNDYVFTVKNISNIDKEVIKRVLLNQNYIVEDIS